MTNIYQNWQDITDTHIDADGDKAMGIAVAAKIMGGMGVTFDAVNIAYFPDVMNLANVVVDLVSETPAEPLGSSAKLQVAIDHLIQEGFMPSSLAKAVADGLMEMGYATTQQAQALAMVIDPDRMPETKSARPPLLGTIRSGAAWAPPAS